MNTYLITREQDSEGYVCRANGDVAFIGCLSELENETQIRFVDHTIFYDDFSRLPAGVHSLVEENNGDKIVWQVRQVAVSLELKKEILHLVSVEEIVTG